jgi:hypothetical protein
LPYGHKSFEFARFHHAVKSNFKIMNPGRSIRLFLVDGTPNGLLTAEIMNWTGHVLTGPRSKLSELIDRPECKRTGIYFLLGPPLDNSLHPQVYIGETDNVAARLKQHNRNEDKNSAGSGKDFWETVCLVTSKDENLTKAHVKYLESCLIKIATDVGRCTLLNGTAHDYFNLPESDRADMSFFIEQVRIVLPVLGLDFLRERPTSSTQLSSTLPLFIIESKDGVKAEAQEIDGEFVVLANSLARDKGSAANHSYQTLHSQLCKDGVLLPCKDSFQSFAADYAFKSPSAAAAIVTGRSSNGRKEWKLKSDRSKSYGDWQNQQVNDATETAMDTEVDEKVI